MPCDYPRCVGGQSGTVCRDECKTACHGPCQQGRLPCPTPDACEQPDGGTSAVSSFVLGLVLVLVVLFIVWVLS